MTGHTTTKRGVRQHRGDDGRYTFDGNYERVCRCGHTLARHFAGSPHECSFGTQKEDAGAPRCECQKFRPK